MNQTMREAGRQVITAGYDQTRILDATRQAQTLSETLECIDQLQAQLAGLKLHIISEAFACGATTVIDQTQNSVRHTPTVGKSLIRTAQDLTGLYHRIGHALCEGTVSLAQASAMVEGLRQLRSISSVAELNSFQETLLVYASELDPNQLRQLAAHLYEVVAPDQAEAAEAARLERQTRRARAGRGLRFRDDHHGSIILTGQLPAADAALIQAQLEALMPSKTSYLASGEAPDVDARRADALMLLASHAAAAESLPCHGGDRPHMHVTVPLAFLTDGLGQAHLIGPGQHPITPGEARRMACDAGIIPIVLDSGSVILDLGREQRLVPAELRAALTARDQGCVFPSCGVAPAACEAHHIQPWWAGGATSVANTMLLCPFHHRLVEPDPEQSHASQWEAFLDPETGRACFIPPTHIDPTQAPRQHRRHRVPDILNNPTSNSPRTASETTQTTTATKTGRTEKTTQTRKSPESRPSVWDQPPEQHPDEAEPPEPSAWDETPTPPTWAEPHEPIDWNQPPEPQPDAEPPVWDQPPEPSIWDEPVGPSDRNQSPEPQAEDESPEHIDDRDECYAVAFEPEDDPWHPHAWGPAEPRAG